MDYISFKFQDLKDWKEKELASYLLKLGFNCYRESRKLRKSIKTPIFMGLKNIHEACFVVDNPYWQGTVVTFSGLSAKFFYMLLKKKSFSPKLFLIVFLIDLIFITVEKIEKLIKPFRNIFWRFAIKT